MDSAGGSGRMPPRSDGRAVHVPRPGRRTSAPRSTADRCGTKAASGSCRSRRSGRGRRLTRRSAGSSNAPSDGGSVATSRVSFSNMLSPSTSANGGRLYPSPYWTPERSEIRIYLEPVQTRSISAPPCHQPADASTEARLVRQGSTVYWSWIGRAPHAVRPRWWRHDGIPRGGRADRPGPGAASSRGRLRTATTAPRQFRPAPSPEPMPVAAPTTPRRSSSNRASPTAALGHRGKGPGTGGGRLRPGW